MEAAPPARSTSLLHIRYCSREAGSGDVVFLSVSHHVIDRLSEHK
jgi:hypothetical protein